MVFASTPLFEPFAIPLLLEKLSSSLPSTKVESLKYLSYCTQKYGADRMAKHVEALWSALKDAIYTSAHSVLSLESELLDGMSFQDNEIVTEALVLLQKVISQNNSLLLDLIVSDEDINTTVDTIHSFKGYSDIPMQSKQRLHAVGRILSVSSKASIDSCNRVFENFFPRLMDALGISVQNPDEDIAFSSQCNFGATYLCIELLAACRALVVGSDELTTINFPAHETWCNMLCCFSSSLTKAFCSTLVTGTDESSHNAYLHSGVKGLQVLATFPGGFSPVSKSIYESILMQLMAIITLDFNKTSLWKLGLKALVDIGSFVHKSEDSEKARSFGTIVVEKIASLMISDDLNMPPSLKVETISSIGMSGLDYMLRILQGLDKALSTCLCGVYVHGDVKLAETTISLLECYSSKVLPWFDSIQGFEEVPLHFAVNIWDQIENSTSFSIDFQKEKLLPVAMAAMKHAVGICLEENQGIIVRKAFNILLSSTSFLVRESMSETTLVTVDGSQFDGFSCRDEWIISLFASVIIALRPQTHIANVKVILQLFLTAYLNGHVTSAQALGSIINKLPVKINGMDSSKDCSLEEAMDMIFSSIGWSSCNTDPLTKCSATGYGNEIGIKNLRLRGKNNRLLQTHAIVGLAWIGKGLLMRGHEKVKDIILTFLSCLLLNCGMGILSWKLKDSAEQEVLYLMRSAADAFHILISDSETCLNRRFHATIQPLYKQRLFSIVLPILLSSVVKADSTISRAMLYRAFAHVVSCTPLSAILSEAKKLIPMLLDGLSMLSEDILNKDIVYNVLLVLSGIMTDKNGQEAVVENANIIIGRLIELFSYPHMMLIRETAIQCLIAMSELPYARIYPMRTQVLLSISKALNDPKRVVRQEAVRCRQAWASIASRSLHF